MKTKTDISKLRSSKDIENKNIQTWIVLHANLIVESLNSSLKGQTINELFNPEVQLFENMAVFDEIVKSCFFIRRTNDPNELDRLYTLKATGKSVYILYNDTQLYYIDYYSNLTKFTLDSILMLKIDDLFPKIPNKFQPALTQNITDLQLLINHSNSSLIDDFFEAFFKDLKEIKPAGKFYKEVLRISHHLFSPVEKSTAWINFAKQHEISDNIYHFIAVNFSYKMMSFWIEKYRNDDKYLDLQCFNAIRIIAGKATKKLFIEECTKILQNEIQEQESNLGKSKNEKTKDLQHIKENIYFKLLEAESHKNHTKEVQKFIKFLNNSLDSKEEENLKNSTEIHDNSLKLRSKSTSFYKKSRSENDAESSSMKPLENSKLKHKSASFQIKKESSSEKTPRSLPINIKPPTNKTDLIFPFTPSATENEAQENQMSGQLPTTSLTHREMRQSGKGNLEESKPSQKNKPKPKQQYYIHYASQNFPAEKVGEMETPTDHITFFAVTRPKTKSIDLNEEKPSVFSISPTEPQ